MLKMCRISPVAKFIAAGAVFFLAVSHAASHAYADQPARPFRAVLEMFTSQGCSSCPPADKIMGYYAREEQDVLALSWHVDYWNYLGWKDTFSKAEFTKRQYSYANAFKRRGVYTPQAVVNGRDHVVGSRMNAIENAMLSHTRAAGAPPLAPVSIVHEGGKIKISAKGPELAQTIVWLIYFDRSGTVKIERGENAGETITYHNIVRDFSMLGMNHDGEIDLILPADAHKRAESEACAVLVQKTVENGAPGPIVAAGVLYDLKEG